MANDSTIQQVENAGAACMDKARETAFALMEKNQDAVKSAAHTLGDAGCAIGAKTNQASAAVASGMKSLAGAIRENLPGDGVFGTASSSVAESLESGGRYLQREGLGGVARDTTSLIRRHPIPALLVGIGIGFLLAKVSVRSISHGQ